MGSQRGVVILSASIGAALALISVIAWAQHDTNRRSIRTQQRGKSGDPDTATLSHPIPADMPASPRDRETARQNPKEEKDRIATEKRRIEQQNVASLVQALKQCAVSDDPSPKRPLIATLSRKKEVAKPVLEEALRNENDPRVAAFLNDALQALSP